MGVLVIFPDTNVFLQCRPLEQVDWSALGQWDEVQVVITRPVQAEIDAFKGKGNSRQASRARAASTLIRELVLSETGSVILRECPLVILSLRSDLRADPSAEALLDYSEYDDKLVGTALAFQKGNQAAEVWLLTNDTGPMASAKAVGLAFRPVPESWLLPVEPDEADKREQSLRSELARYKSQEPSFEIKVADGAARVESSLAFYRDFTEQELVALLEKLRDAYPLGTEFGPTGTMERLATLTAAHKAFRIDPKEVFKPATEDDIERYREAYWAWHGKCQSVLEGLPAALNRLARYPSLVVSIANLGSRPAENVLVALEGAGAIQLRAPKVADSDGGTSTSEGRPKLYAPPVVPKGRWEPAAGRDLLKSIDEITKVMKSVGIAPPLLPLKNGPLQVDPDRLYFKDGRRGSIHPFLSYSRQRWRHAQAEGLVEHELVCPLKEGIHAGSVKLEVHATNLTAPKELLVPVRITVAETSCVDFAEQLIERARFNLGPEADERGA